ncbi:hypothetical protein M5K25_003769 [Dendrobium thyrsiflorum]|uniref:Uncharacterized protein n=1 Tax=Dendrobium thyrsiflorum TaxID=117978 RepID=A0ABD0VK32_DENTH
MLTSYVTWVLDEAGWRKDGFKIEPVAARTQTALFPFCIIETSYVRVRAERGSTLLSEQSVLGTRSRARKKLNARAQRTGTSHILQEIILPGARTTSKFNINDVLQCHLFFTTLKDSALSWFTHLPRGCDRLLHRVQMDVHHTPDVHPTTTVGSGQQAPISKYRTLVKTQSSRVERLDSSFKLIVENDNDGIIRELLINFYASPGKRKPDQIIIDGQASDVLPTQLSKLYDKHKLLRPTVEDLKNLQEYSPHLHCNMYAHRYTKGASTFEAFNKENSSTRHKAYEPNPLSTNRQSRQGSIHESNAIDPHTPMMVTLNIGLAGILARHAAPRFPRTGLCGPHGLARCASSGLDCADIAEEGREGRDDRAPYFLGRPRFLFADSAAMVAAAAGRAEVDRAVTAQGMANEFASTAAEENGVEKISLPAVANEAAPSMT